MSAQEATLSAENAAAALLGWQRNARTTLQWVHVSWLEETFGHDRHALLQYLNRPGLRDDEGLSLIVLDALLPRRATLEQFLACAASRLDALPIALGLRVLRMQALMLRRSEVRRLLDRATRTRLAQWVDCSLDMLMDTGLQASTLAPPSKGTPNSDSGAAMPLEEMNADQLAMEGLVHLTAHHRNPGDMSIAALLRLALPRETCLSIQPSFLSTTPARAPLLEGRIRQFLPREYAWLSG